MLIKLLLDNKWNRHVIAYGSRNKPKEGDGIFRSISIGTDKKSESYKAYDYKVYQQMLELQKIIKTETFVDEINTELVIGATMRVKLENYDALINELINME